ncbi:MAG: thioesterase family protein [Clostridia bacterium]|nr:thioesterase family protein [Clostridia bacterium]
MKQIENYKINVHDTDLNGLLSPTGYLRYLQDAAFCQMECDGPSYNELFEKGLAFILSRIRILFFEPVRSHEVVTVSTWSCGGHAASFIRCYRMEKDGVETARGKSVWALYDVNEKKLKRYSDEDFHYGKDEEADVDMPRRPEFAGEPALLGTKKVFYTDADQNRHMNNTRYADMLWHFFPGRDEMRIASLDISYLNEAPLGCELDIYGGESADGDGYVFKTVRRDDGKVNVLAKITAVKI